MVVKVLVLTGFGINCDLETQHAFRAVGADAERIHLNDIILGEKRLGDYEILAFPGGFSFGDDIASGKVLANKFKHHLKKELEEFVHSGKLVIGICNGFQALVKMGLLPALDGNYFSQQATLTFNDSGRFEDRWVWLKVNPASKCVFTKGIEKLYLPVRHGEGKFVADQRVLERLKKQGQVVAQYTDPEGKLAGYPWNPNGSLENIAGVCDETGRVYGMMPHPEAFNHFTNHPRWTRGEFSGEGMGIPVFRNAVEYAEKSL
jgi:phosphoribosylformylglycinamidine synthase